ncbi:MAG: thiolase family protein [Alphaproteobacteria bacterium]|nr:thiolase family protein [Alphaproteobacteria bacterium]MDX5368201.1 thiolase family protein [Alphaproteobacteria bacterium]MDX5463013.1 thiolase family protein [Alphaproteobacteria bacterium]
MQRGDQVTTAWIAGVGDTSFGRHEGLDTLDLMSAATRAALDDAGMTRADVDGVLTGYSTAMPHLMLASLFAEHFGLDPSYCHSMQMGGGTGCGLVMLAKLLVESGQCETVLVAAGENRLTNTGGRDSVIQTLAQVGHATQEVPFGATIPGYYGLLASAYMAAYGITEEDLAELAVLMRTHAALHPGSHLTDPITVADVMASRPIATPLKLLDCCPISDGGVAVIVTADKARSKGVRLAGAGQAHQHQHISAAPSLSQFGGGPAAARAFAEAGLAPKDVQVAGVYDSFTITAAILLEEIGLAERGEAAARARAGDFGPNGVLPLNTHGGLLSFGHSGVAGGMAHFVEVVRQMLGKADARQMPTRPEIGFVHGDGGILSSHVSLLLTQS